MHLTSQQTMFLKPKKCVTYFMKKYLCTNRSELVAAKIAIEMIIEYKFKLRMLVVLIIGMSLSYGKNMAAVTII